MDADSPFASEQARSLMTEALSSDPVRLDLAALSIAILEYPDLDLASCDRQLESYAVRVRAKGPTDGIEGLAALREVLADEEGFGGAGDEYHHPLNSFFNRVLERKRGLPISLGILYLDVARRVGLPLFGVSFPGRYLTAMALPEGRNVVLDPFDGGRLLDEHGCATLLKQVAPQLRFQSRMLVAASGRATAYRLLNNLKRFYLSDGDGERALAVVDLMLTASPDHPGELRARATILAALGAYRAALTDVERCLHLSPRAPDCEVLMMRAKALRQRVSLLN